MINIQLGGSQNDAGALKEFKALLKIVGKDLGALVFFIVILLIVCAVQLSLLGLPVGNISGSPIGDKVADRTAIILSGIVDGILFLGQLTILMGLPILYLARKSILRMRSRTTDSMRGKEKNKIITPEYNPPEEMEPAMLFRFRYNSSNPRIILAILYYLQSKKAIKIEYVAKKIWFLTRKEYHIITNLIEQQEKIERYTPREAKPYKKPELTKLEKHLLKNLLPNETLIVKSRRTRKNRTIIGVYHTLKAHVDRAVFLEGNSNNTFVKDPLNPFGKKMLNHLYGYKEYLEKVEKPVIEMELKKDPEYINKIFPRLILFGIRKDLTKLQEKLVKMNQIRQIIGYYDGEQVLF